MHCRMLLFVTIIISGVEEGDGAIKVIYPAKSNMMICRIIMIIL